MKRVLMCGLLLGLLTVILPSTKWTVGFGALEPGWQPSVAEAAVNGTPANSPASTGTAQEPCTATCSCGGCGVCEGVTNACSPPTAADAKLAECCAALNCSCGRTPPFGDDDDDVDN
jgi:hypothetical protein